MLHAIASLKVWRLGVASVGLAAGFSACSLHDVSYLEAGGGGGGGGRAGSAAQAGSNAAGAITTAGLGGEPSSAAGASTEGGEAGQGSTTQECGASVSCQGAGMISDFEGASLVCDQNFAGYWQVYSDGTGTSVPPSGDVAVADLRDGCTRDNGYALHFSGSGFSGFGATISARLEPSDVSQYRGLRFSAYTSKAVAIIRVKIATTGTLGKMYGGSCEAPATCDDYFGKNVTLSKEWHTYEVPFAEFTQEGAQSNMQWDPTTARDIAFFVKGLSAGGMGVFDFWIDDVEYYK